MPRMVSNGSEEGVKRLTDAGFNFLSHLEQDQIVHDEFFDFLVLSAVNIARDLGTFSCIGNRGASICTNILFQARHLDLDNVIISYYYHNYYFLRNLS